MRIRKKGYPALLAITIALTVTGIASTVAPSSMLPFENAGHHLRLGVAMGFLVLAGVVCTIRKRFFTEER